MRSRIIADHGNGRSTLNVAVKSSRRGRKPCPIEEFPEALTQDWTDPNEFRDALALHMERHGDSSHHLGRAITEAGHRIDHATIRTWLRGDRMPQSTRSMVVLRWIEQRYRLPEGYFKAKFPHPARAALGPKRKGISPAEQRRLAWHLSDDFDRRPKRERDAILEWVRNVIVTGATDYRRFQAEAMKHRYAIRFPALTGRIDSPSGFDDEEWHHLDDDPDLAEGSVTAPFRLAQEMSALVAFKTSTLTSIGFQRNGVWNDVTSAQRVEHFGLLFGALAASPRGAVAGFGVPLADLSFAMLVFPSVWDWYVQWREHRRGFYTRWEVDMLRLGLALTRAETGWLRQNPELASRLRPIPPLVSQADVDAAQVDWDAACDRFHKHGLVRAKEIDRVARVHRDPFDPILEAASPVTEYRKIIEEIIRLMPDAKRYPRDAAEAVRSFLMLRLGLHLGLRQRNLKELLICPPGRPPRSERQLETLKRGEMRWDARLSAWEVLIPSIAFKNANSSFFGGKPFRLRLPDLGNLYAYISSYVRIHRNTLLGKAADPGTFFVKTVKTITA